MVNGVSVESSTAPAIDLSPETATLLERIGALPKPRPLARRLLWIAAPLGALLAAWWTHDSAGPPPVHWETVSADRGDIEIHVVATGSLQARSEIAVGAEMSGRVASVEVDVNDRVTRGQVLVRLDRETAVNGVAEAEASLRAANADLARARTTLRESKSVANRVESLAQRGLVSEEERDAQRANAALAESDVTRATAQVNLAKIRVEQAKTNLEKLVIVAPIDGIVMARTVEPGNAIAASFAAPELFRIAEDLAEMELHLPINEADVGRLRAGQQASFRVDAWPQRVFDASVVEVSYAPEVIDNVVTYDAVLQVENPDLALRPGMTATATVLADTRKEVERVPNVALRFAPQTATTRSFTLFGPPRMRGGGETKSQAPGVWVLHEGEPKRVRLTLGPSDGQFTEITAGDLEAGDLVITGQGEPS